MSEQFSMQQKLYRVVCYMPTITIKYKFERNTCPEYYTRNETVIIKKTITQWGVAIAHPDTIFILYWNYTKLDMYWQNSNDLILHWL